MLHAVIYVESHYDKQLTFLGVFSTEEKAEAARDSHMESEQLALPRASINKYNYSIYGTEVDSGVVD